jgi:fatty-acyl-CoA synthase
MQGLMMDYPLTLQHFFQRATRIFTRREIVTQTDTGLHRYTYGEWGKRIMQLAHALHNAGVTDGDLTFSLALQIAQPPGRPPA